MGVVGILVVAHPELYGDLSQHLGDGSWNGNATLVHIDVMVGSLLRYLKHDGIGGS